MQEVPADSENFPWYMTDSIAVLEDSYSEVVVNVIDLALNWQLFSDVGRPRSFVNVMSTNSTLDPERRRHSYLKGIPLCSDRVKLFWGGGGGGGGLIFETNCIFEYKPSPHFRLDVVYKMGGRINGTLRYNHNHPVACIHSSSAANATFKKNSALSSNQGLALYSQVQYPPVAMARLTPNQLFMSIYYIGINSKP